MFNLPGSFIASFLRSQYTKLPYPDQDQTGKVIVVTGANVGLGLEAARHFARLNAQKVILACRSYEKGETAKWSIESTIASRPISQSRTEGEKQEPIIEVWRLDLNEYRSIIAFCKRLETLDRLDVIIENAGIAIPTFIRKEGMESTIQTNVIGTFLLALLALPVMRRSGEKHGTVPVLGVVASEAHFQAVFAERSQAQIFQALNTPTNQSDRYNTSKLLEILIVRSLASQMTTAEQGDDKKAKVVLNCLTPGLCESDLMRHASPLLAVAARIGKVLLARTTEVGSRTLISAAMAGDLSHGEYLADCAIAVPSAFVTGEEGREVQQRVWDELIIILEGIVPGIGDNI